MVSSDFLRGRLYGVADSLVEPAQIPDDLAAMDRLARRESSPITIGIATSDDFDGAFFTLAALSLTHPEVMERAEVLLIDNHPTGVESRSLREALGQFPRVRYVPVRSVTSTAVRDLLFRLATGEVVVVLDSHVLVQPGGLAAVVDYLAGPGCRDLVQGPLLRGGRLDVYATHMDPVWRAGMYGAWGVDERFEWGSLAALEIPLQGLGAFAMRRDAWPGLHPHFTGFGGEEGYLHEKVRQRGGRTVCLPAFGWVHRFGHPRGVKYDLSWESRTRNYVLGWSELSMDVDSVRAHFVDYVGGGIGAHIDRVRADIQHPLWRFDGVVVLNDDARPGRWRHAAQILRDVSMVPRRLALPQMPRSRDGADFALRAGQRYARYWGWRDYAIVGDEAVVAAGDSDGLSALLDASLEAPDSPYTLAHSAASGVDAGRVPVVQGA